MLSRPQGKNVLFLNFKRLLPPPPPLKKYNPGLLFLYSAWCLISQKSKWHKRTLQTIPCHHEEESQNTKSHKITVTRHQAPGGVAQSVTCLATDACLTADPGLRVRSRSGPILEIDHEIISTVILLPSADLFKKGCCQLQAKVCARITG